ETIPIRQYTRRARIAQSSAFPTVADEPASPLRDVSQGKACPTDSGFEEDQDRANIAKTSTLPHDSAPRVTSPIAAEGSMQQTLNELTAFCTSLQRQHLELISKFEAHELEINRLKVQVKLLEDREGLVGERYVDDAPIKGRNLDKGEAAAERVSDDTEEMVTVLTSMDATTVLASRVAEVPTGSRSIPTAGPPAAEVPTGSGSIPNTGPPAAEVPTGSDVVPTASPVFATGTVVTPYRRRKGKEIMVESETLKKKKVQEQIDAQVARDLEEKMAREDQRMSEQVARDAEITRIHAEEELIASGKKNRADKSNLGWKVKDFKGMTFEEIKAKFTTVWKQLEDFIPMGSKEEAERLKRKRLSLEQESVKKLKTSKEVHEEAKSPDEVPEEKVKEMMQLVPIKEVYVEALQVKHPIIDWKVHTDGQRAYWKITRLGGSSASYQFFIDLLKHLYREDLNQLWALVKESLSNRQPTSDKEMELWLYDMCGVHQVTSKDKEIFMLVEKDYPLRKGLALMMICYKLQVENYSQMANDLILKIYKIANCPIIEFPLAEEVSTASKESCHCQKKREATAVKIALLSKSRRNCQSKSNDSYAKDGCGGVKTVVRVTMMLMVWLRWWRGGDDGDVDIGGSEWFGGLRVAVAVDGGKQDGDGVDRDYLTKFDPKSYEGAFLLYSQNSKAYIILNKHTMKVEESLNVTFDETPHPSKTLPLEDDDLVEEETIEFVSNDVWELVPNPMNMTIIGTKWVFRNKLDENGVVSRKKARLVAQGYNQQEGIDYDETYAPVAILESIRILLAYACALDFKLFQMDVKSAFLNDFINKEVYVPQPSGFIDFAKPNHVYRLKKALYGLKQAPKAEYDRLKAFLIKHDYSMGMVDSTLFTKKKDPDLIIVQIYVDYIIFGSTCQEMCDDFVKIMHDEFEIKTKLTKDVEGESVDNTKYRGMIGSLLYLTTSRPDIMFSVCLCARFQENPKASHLEAVKRIFRYIKGTMHLGLWYPKGSGIETLVYADSDHARDYVDRKSNSGICKFMGCCLTSWFSKKQTALAISTTEVEYVSAGKACQQALWMKQVLVDYGIRLHDIPIMCDNKEAIDLSKNPIQHSRTKHIEIRHHLLRENVQKRNIFIEMVSSEDNIADILTKPLKHEPFNYLRLGLGMMEKIE
nr:retrovirus-related Pol polyprotein from transposon TNT 1-94 [Tanacetum cinerariifolium]GEX38026.1 retrovirus-related Pol polyprotein from transposon TNT 1-94 [Tanacetum cinerariifolium]